MTTTKQERKTLETPFGTATIHDWRGHKTDNATVASIGFDRFVANRKDYGTVTLYLDRPAKSWQTVPSISTSFYRALTDAARQKVSEYFIPNGSVIADLAPYMEELDAEDARASLKSRIAHKALRGLDDALTDFVDRNDAEGRALAVELLDEVLRETMARREAGEKYIDIYLNL